VTDAWPNFSGIDRRAKTRTGGSRYPGKRERLTPSSKTQAGSPHTKYRRENEKQRRAASPSAPSSTYRHPAKSIDPKRPDTVLGLSRLAIATAAPKNAASYLISKAARRLPQKYENIATWADTARAHVGAVYQAANYRYLGMT